VANKFDRADAQPLPTGLAAELERLVVYADAQERKVSQLQSALDSRVVIEQAIGMLAERFDLQFADAFELLRAAARNTGQQVRAIAEELRASRRTPAEVSDLLPRDGRFPLSSYIEAAEYLRCPRCGVVAPD